MDMISKHTTDTGKIRLSSIYLIPKDNIMPLDKKPYTLPLKHHTWLRKELTDLEKEGIISPSTSNFASPIIIVPKKEDPSTH